jgi:hypothetical protein
MASVVLVGSAASCTWGMKSAPQSFAAANYNVRTNTHTDELTVFPPDGNGVKISIPFRLRDVAFGADGRSVYGINVTNPNGVIQDTGGLSKVEFNPIRRVPVPGTATFGIWSFAFSAGEDKVVISGYHRETGVHAVSRMLPEFIALLGMRPKCIAVSSRFSSLLGLLDRF